MGALKFTCPNAKVEVFSGLDRDPESLSKLPANDTTLYCPYCDEPHLLADVEAWIEGDEKAAKKAAKAA